MPDPGPKGPAPAPFLHTTQGRSRRTVGVMILAWFVLGSLVIVFRAAWWIVGVLAVFTLPLLVDIATNRTSGLRIADGRVSWFTGRHEAAMAIADIARMRIDIRLDQSARVTLIDAAGRKTRLPYECVPPARRLEEAAHAHGIAVDRRPFALL